MGRVDIFTAVQDGNLSGVRAELAAGVDPNNIQKGQTALMLACEKGHADICELLIRNGAKVDAQDAYQRTALYQSVAFNHPQCAKVLMSHGAQVETRSWLGGETPLDIAKLRSNVELQRALTNVGSPPQNALSITAAQRTAPTNVSSATVIDTLDRSVGGSVEKNGAGHSTQHLPIAVSLPRRAPAPEVDESTRPPPLLGSNSAL